MRCVRSCSREQQLIFSFPPCAAWLHYIPMQVRFFSSSSSFVSLTRRSSQIDYRFARSQIPAVLVVGLTPSLSQRHVGHSRVLPWWTERRRSARRAGEGDRIGREGVGSRMLPLGGSRGVSIPVRFSFLASPPRRSRLSSSPQTSSRIRKAVQRRDVAWEQRLSWRGVRFSLPSFFRLLIVRFAAFSSRSGLGTCGGTRCRRFGRAESHSTPGQFVLSLGGNCAAT